MTCILMSLNVCCFKENITKKQINRRRWEKRNYLNLHSHLLSLLLEYDFLFKKKKRPKKSIYLIIYFLQIIYFPLEDILVGTCDSLLQFLAIVL